MKKGKAGAKPEDAAILRGFSVKYAASAGVQEVELDPQWSLYDPANARLFDKPSKYEPRLLTHCRTITAPLQPPGMTLVPGRDFFFTKAEADKAAAARIKRKIESLKKQIAALEARRAAL